MQNLEGKIRGVLLPKLNGSPNFCMLSNNNDKWHMELRGSR